MTHELELLRKASAEMRVTKGQLLLEKSSLAAYARVEKIAVKQLDMLPPSASQTVIIRKP